MLERQSTSSPMSKLSETLVGETRFGCLKFKGTPGLVHYCVPLLCKVFLTARLFVSHWSSIRSHCSSKLNIANKHPKELSLGIDEIFLIFSSFITPKHKRCRQISTKTHKFQH